ncbi:MAG: hypothetical protein H7282_05510 [Cytophagaceae bacterium]|nr:hypothetical protein [Cytophagaceae bacterium]
MKYLSTLLIVCVAQVTFAQKMLVTLAPTTAQLFEESIPVKNPKKANLATGSMGILGVQKGYATQGYTYADLQKKGGEAFTITLEKISPLPAAYVSKALELKKITDATGKVEKPDRMGMYGITVKGTELNSTPFTSAISKSFIDFGYKMDESGGVFENKDKGAIDFAIGSELLYFSKDKRGDGYQVSIIVEWSIYSYSEKKVIKKIITAGYSDTGETQFNPELISAFKDATQGLAGNLEFQKTVKK